MLRAGGHVHSAHRWRDVLDPILSRYGATGVRRYFRADAAFPKPDIYEYLEERRVFYAIRLPSNKVLCLPKAVKHWSLRSVQVKLIKMGGRLVRHSRRLIFQLSEVSVPRRLFQGVVDRIGRLSPAPS